MHHLFHLDSFENLGVHQLVIVLDVIHELLIHLVVVLQSLWLVGIIGSFELEVPVNAVCKVLILDSLVEQEFFQAGLHPGISFVRLLIPECLH